MRKPSPTTLAAAVAIALFAHAADAQTRGAANAGRVNAGPNATAPSSASSAGTITTSNGVVIGNTSQGIGSGTINAAALAGSTATLASTSQGNVAVVGTPIAGANATGTNAGTVNLQGAQLVDQQGRVLTDANGQPLSMDARGVIGVAPIGGLGTDTGVAGNGTAQVVILNAGDLAGSVTSTPELDRATRKELNKAKLASRSNKQLLNTIAPRTNANRTDQMADDPPSPALSTPDRSLPRN